MRYWLVMPAAGAGRRFGSALPKQYAPLAGRTVIEWALQPFLRDVRCRACVVVIAPDDAHWSAIAERLGTSVRVAPGGIQRADSVRSGLAVLAHDAAPEDWVLVQDAARPCLEAADLDRLIDEAAADATGGLLAIPCTDTIKRADEHLSVEATLPREVLWRAVTPQMFRYGALCTALDLAHAAQRQPTDESQAMEWQGARPRLVPGAASNIKITDEDDLALAETVLARRRKARA